MLPSLRRPQRHSSLTIRISLLFTLLMVNACSGSTSPGSSVIPSTSSLGSNTQPLPSIQAQLGSEHGASGDSKASEEQGVDPPSATQIKADLVGQRVSDIDISSPDQVVDVILDQAHDQARTDQAQVRYPVTLVVEDSQTQERYRVDTLLVYALQGEHWTLQTLTTKNLVLLPEPIPSPPTTPVTLGQPARVGAFTVVVHDIQRVDWREQELGEESSNPQEQRLLVDISLRNDTKHMVVWPADAIFTVISANGTALNAEYGDIQREFAEGATGLLPSDLQTETCTKRVADLLRPVTYLKRLLPGEVTRRWLSYQQTPGLEQDDLQLEVTLPGPQGDKQSYRTHFLLHGTPNMSPLPSQATTAQPVAEGRLGAFVINGAQIGPIGEIQDSLRRNLMPCTFQRTVTMQVENTSPQTETFTTGIWLVDAHGRMYEPLPIDDRYSLEPRQTQTISFLFPALLGVREHPVALLLGEASLDTTVRKTDPPQRLLLQLAEHE